MCSIGVAMTNIFYNCDLACFFFLFKLRRHQRLVRHTFHREFYVQEQCGPITNKGNGKTRDHTFHPLCCPNTDYVSSLSPLSSRGPPTNSRHHMDGAAGPEEGRGVTSSRVQRTHCESRLCCHSPASPNERTVMPRENGVPPPGPTLSAGRGGTEGVR